MIFRARIFFAYIRAWTFRSYTKREQLLTSFSSHSLQASSLTRLRHPCILEVVEPLEETRSEITFATELVTAPLSEALIADSRSDFQLDEVETQKGLLQISRGLEFLHGAGMVHGNLTPEALLINSKVRETVLDSTRA